VMWLEFRRVLFRSGLYWMRNKSEINGAKRLLSKNLFGCAP